MKGTLQGARVSEDWGGCWGGTKGESSNSSELEPKVLKARPTSCQARSAERGRPEWTMN